MGQSWEQGQDVLSVVERQIEAITQTPDLLRHFEYPQIAAGKLELLNLFLKESGWSEEQRLRVCTATAFAQLGLDIHENVTAAQPLDGEAKRHRQLSILAGDFFSSQFYALLADGGEIQVIPIIAQAISDINQAKMRLYQNDGNISFQQLLREYTIIHSALYANFTQLDARRGPWWKMLIERFIVTEQASVSPAGTGERIFMHPEWEALLPSWLNDMERLIQQATTDTGTYVRLQQRFFYVQKRFARLSTEVTG